MSEIKACSPYAIFSGQPCCQWNCWSATQSLQGSSTFPLGIADVDVDVVAVIPQTIGVPRVITAAFGKTTGISNTFTLGDGTLTVTMPAQARIAFITNVARPDPVSVEQTPCTTEMTLTIGADNTYNMSATVVSGFITTGVPNMIGLDPVTDVNQYTAIKKEVDRRQAWMNVEVTIAPDQGVQQLVRVLSLTTVPLVGQDVIVVCNEDWQINVAGTGTFLPAPCFIRLGTPHKIPLFEFPSVIVPSGYSACAIALSYTVANGLLLTIVENPPEALQGKRLPWNQYGDKIWVATVLRKTSTSWLPQQQIDCIVSNTFGTRLTVLQSLVMNTIFVGNTGKPATALIPDGQLNSNYGVPQGKIADDAEKWNKTAEEYNDPRNLARRRIQIVSSKSSRIMRNPRED